MKAVLFTISAIVILTSCNKAYRCNCTYPDAKYRGTQSILLESRKSDAESTCKQMSVVAAEQGGACALQP